MTKELNPLKLFRNNFVMMDGTKAPDAPITTRKGDRKGVGTTVTRKAPEGRKLTLSHNADDKEDPRYDLRATKTPDGGVVCFAARR